jgi:hypothetical protein
MKTTLIRTIRFGAVSAALAISAACARGVSSDPTANDSGSMTIDSGSNHQEVPKHPVSWSARSGLITLSADDFYIIAGGHKYVADVKTVAIHSDPGTSQYTTLELTWIENAVEMRLYLYFDSDGTSWWSDEARTYNGMAVSPDWIYYHGSYFTSPAGSMFTGNLDLTGDVVNAVPGSIHFENLRLKVTFTP